MEKKRCQKENRRILTRFIGILDILMGRFPSCMVFIVTRGVVFRMESFTLDEGGGGVQYDQNSYLLQPPAVWVLTDEGPCEGPTWPLRLLLLLIIPVSQVLGPEGHQALDHVCADQHHAPERTLLQKEDGEGRVQVYLLWKLLIGYGAGTGNESSSYITE